MLRFEVFVEDTRVAVVFEERAFMYGLSEGKGTFAGMLAGPTAIPFVGLGDERKFEIVDGFCRNNVSPSVGCTEDRKTVGFGTGLGTS